MGGRTKSMLTMLWRVAVAGIIIGTFAFFLTRKGDHVAFSSTSPDGQFRCDVIEHSGQAGAYIYRFELARLEHEEGEATYGTELVIRTDSLPAEWMSFLWSNSVVTVDAGALGRYQGNVTDGEVWWAKLGAGVSAPGSQ